MNDCLVPDDLENSASAQIPPILSAKSKTDGRIKYIKAAIFQKVHILSLTALFLEHLHLGANGV